MDHGNTFYGANFSYDASDIVFRCLTIRGVHNYDTKHLQWGVDFLAQTQEKFPFKKLITHKYSLDEINQAMRMAQSGEAIRVAIYP